MKLVDLAILQKLENSNKILLSGAGGGFDIFCGLPLYFHLLSQGKQVVLGNLTFTRIQTATGRQLSPAVKEVNYASGGPDDYFPEKYLSQWFHESGKEVSIQCFSRTGAIPLQQAYQAVCQHYDIDTIILVDGGTDSLMQGDEAGLGTPQEEIASIAAVDGTNVANKFLLCLGFGIDAFHGVNHCQFLQAVAALAKQKAFFGIFSLLPEMEEVQYYQDAYNYVTQCMPGRPSIVTSSVISAIQGEYGDFQTTTRTQNNTLWINPLMSTYWSFALDQVANRCLYIDKIRSTKTYEEVTVAIENFRLHCDSIKSWEKMPI